MLNAIERTLVLFEANIPVVKLPPSVSVPDVNVYVPVAAKVRSLFKVTEPEVCVNVVTEPELMVAVPPYVNTPGEITVIVEGLIFPDVKLYVPVTVSVPPDIDTKLSCVPDM